MSSSYCNQSKSRKKANGCEKKKKREISSCIDIIRAMSTQWEPAKHCHRALTLLLRAVSRRQETAGPAATATITATTAGADQSTSLPGVGEEAPTSQPHAGLSSKTRKKRKLDSNSAPAEQDFAEDHGVDTSGLAGNTAGDNGLGVSGLFGGNAVLGQGVGDWDQSLDLDMNMVDLLQEGNFDSLMDLFGQQYPTF